MGDRSSRAAPLPGPPHGEAGRSFTSWSAHPDVCLPYRVSAGHVHFGVVFWLSGVCGACVFFLSFFFFFYISSVLAMLSPGIRITI